MIGDSNFTYQKYELLREASKKKKKFSMWTLYTFPIMIRYYLFTKFNADLMFMKCTDVYKMLILSNVVSEYESDRNRDMNSKSKLNSDMGGKMPYSVPMSTHPHYVPMYHR